MFHVLLALPAIAVFGTVAGTVLTVLGGLLGLAFIIQLLFGFVFRTVKWLLWLPGVLGSFPLLQVGLPAVLSLYFDIFSGLMQAFIFAMLTMLYIGTAAPEEE